MQSQLSAKLLLFDKYLQSSNELISIQTDLEMFYFIVSTLLYPLNLTEQVQLVNIVLSIKKVLLDNGVKITGHILI